MRKICHILLISLAYVSGSRLLSAASEDVTPEALDAFKHFVEKRQSALTNLKSFDVKGTLSVEVADAYAKVNGGPTKPRWNFTVTSDGGRIREIEYGLDDAGQVTSDQTYYLDSEKIVEVDRDSSSLAKIYSLAKNENCGLFADPVLMEYAFLRISVGQAGIPAMLNSDLVRQEKWAAAIAHLRSATIGTDSSLRFSLTGENGSCEVDLIPAGKANEYQVKGFSFFNKEHVLDRKIEILENFDDKSVGSIGKKFKVSVYRSTIGLPPGTPAAVWTYEIETIKLNAPVDDDALRFDPTSVDKIFDGDNKLFINVPK